MDQQFEFQANLMPPGGIVAFSLSLPRSRPGVGYRALLTLLPFLGLGRSAGVFNQGAVPGHHNSTMPWPEPRWWEGAAVAQPGEVHIHRPEAAPAAGAPFRPLPPAPAPAPGNRPEMLAALAPALCWGRPGPGNPTLLGPAGVLQPLFGLASGGPGLSQMVSARPEAGTGPRSTSWRPAGTAPPGIIEAASPGSQAQPTPLAAAFPPVSQRPGAAPVPASAAPARERRFAAARPSGHLRAGIGPTPLIEPGGPLLPALRPGGPAPVSPAQGGVEPLPLPALLAGRPEVLAGSEKFMAPDRPGFWAIAGGQALALARPPAYQAVDLAWPGPGPGQAGSPPAPESSVLAWTSPAQRQYAKEPGPYAAGGHGLVMAADTIQAIESLVIRQVQTQVARQANTIKGQVADRLVAERRLTVSELVSDEVVQALLQKMRALAREERFRLGRLR